MLNNNSPKHGGDQKRAHKHTEYLMEMDKDYGLQAMMIVEGEKSLNWKIEQYQNALSKEPENAGLHAGIAMLYVKSDQMEKAQEHIDKALELDEQQKDVLLDIVFPFAMKKKYQSAKEMTQRYLDLAENESAAMRSFALFYLAKIEKMSGNPDAGKKLEQSKQTDPDVASFHSGYGSALLARQVGQKKAREIFMIGRPYTAEEAERMGMVNEVVPHDKLEEKALEWGAIINSKSPTAMRMLKFGFNMIDDGMVGQQLFAGEATRLAYGTDEAVEGRDSFLEKRPADYTKFPWHY